jgi:hypothetical protein
VTEEFQPDDRGPKEAQVSDERKRVSMDEIEAEDAVSLPNKEVLSLLDVNANVDLGLDLAAPVDLAAAANLNVAAPIEASAAANVLSPDAQAVSLAQQHGSIDQGISGSADATAPQHATVTQDSNSDGGAATAEPTAPATTEAGATTAEPAAQGVAAPTPGPAPVTEAAPAADAAAAAPADAAGAVGGAVDGATGAVGGAADGATGAVDGATGAVGDAAGEATGAVGGVAGSAGDAVGGVTGSAGDAVGGVTGGVNDLLNGGSLLDANVNIHANADLAAPVDGAIAANANVAAPIDAAVAANIGSDHAVAEALAPQEINISQHLDNVEANATAEQDASVDQK